MEASGSNTELSSFTEFLSGKFQEQSKAIEIYSNELRKTVAKQNEILESHERELKVAVMK